jgi:predicted small lipoprotein YifL
MMEKAMRRLMMVATIALLAGCGPSAPPTPKPEIKVHGEAQKQLAAASELDRTIGLKRAIYDSGNVCRRLIGSRPLAEYKNLTSWQADCDDGRSWAIFVAPEGSVQVRPCADEKELKLPECTAPAVDKAALDKTGAAHKKTAGTKPAA